MQPLHATIRKPVELSHATIACNHQKDENMKISPPVGGDNG